MLLVIVSAAFFGCYALYDVQMEMKSALNQNYADYKPGFDKDSFDKLKKINPDVIGWIDVYGTPIDYPITHTGDNSKYLGTNAFGESAPTGAIFMDAENKSDFTDNINILWGHNMTPQVMFGSIRDFLDEGYFEQRRYGDIYYGNRHHGIVIYGVLSNVFTSDRTVYNPGHFEKDYVRLYFDALLKRSDLKREPEKEDLLKIDNVLILSTCSSEQTNGKNVLICTVTDKTYEDTFDIDEKNIDFIDVYSRLPLLLWLVFAFLILLFVKLLLKMSKEQHR